MLCLNVLNRERVMQYQIKQIVLFGEMNGEKLAMYTKEARALSSLIQTGKHIPVSMNVEEDLRRQGNVFIITIV